MRALQIENPEESVVPRMPALAKASRRNPAPARATLHRGWHFLSPQSSALVTGVVGAYFPPCDSWACSQAMRVAFEATS